MAAEAQPEGLVAAVVPLGPFWFERRLRRAD
jgi:hypothetical protein